MELRMAPYWSEGSPIYLYRYIDVLLKYLKLVENARNGYEINDFEVSFFLYLNTNGTSEVSDRLYFSKARICDVIEHC